MHGLHLYLACRKESFSFLAASVASHYSWLVLLLFCYSAVCPPPLSEWEMVCLIFLERALTFICWMEPWPPSRAVWMRETWLLFTTDLKTVGLADPLPHFNLFVLFGPHAALKCVASVCACWCCLLLGLVWKDWCTCVYCSINHQALKEYSSIFQPNDWLLNLKYTDQSPLTISAQYLEAI